MKTKKTRKANLENKKSLFFQAGLIVALSLTLLAFEWGTHTINTYGISGNNINHYEPELLPPVTDFKKPKPTPPPPVIEEITIVEDIDESFIDDMPSWDAEDHSFEDKPFEDFEEGEDVPFIVVEKMPLFNGGGLAKFQQYLYEHLRYPEEARINNVEGKVSAQFIVNEKGEIESVRILRSIDESLSKEVIRVLAGAPKWTPGEQRGQKVKVIFSIPVYFSLQK